MKIIFYLINKENKEKEVRQEPHEALSDVFWKGFSISDSGGFGKVIYGTVAGRF